MSLGNCVHQSNYHPSQSTKHFHQPRKVSWGQWCAGDSSHTGNSRHLIPISCCYLKEGHDGKSANTTNQRFPHAPLPPRASFPANCCSCPFSVNPPSPERQINIGLLLLVLELHVNGITFCILFSSINVMSVRFISVVIY